MNEGGGSRNGTENISEFETKAILRKFGIDTPRGILVKELPGDTGLKFPLVLKVSDPDILHKSDVGGVALGIGDQVTLEQKFAGMKAKFPESEFIIEETAPTGVEFIAGIIRDPVFGKVIMLGSGGIYTELFKDVVFRKLPLDRADALDMIQGIKSGEFCKGFRGIKIDCELLADLLLKLNRFAVSPEYSIETMDVNPIIVSSTSAVAVDAKLFLDRRE